MDPMADSGHAIPFGHHLREAAMVAAALLSFLMPPKDDKKKTAAGKSDKNGKDPLNKSGGKSKGKVWDLRSITWS